MKGVFRVIGAVVVIAVVAYWLLHPTTATAQFTTIGKNTISIASDVGGTVLGWFGQTTGDIANHKK